MDDRARQHAFDHLKAAAIVAVVLTHAGPDSWVAHEQDPIVWFFTKSWTVFHVPSFLFVSGFLYATTEPVGARLVGRRLGRVLLPYLVWSGVVQLLGLSGAGSPGEVLRQLLTASSVGVYYYILLICGCVVSMALVSRLGRGQVLVLWAVYFAYSAAAAGFPALRTGEGLFWLMREPLQLFAFGFFLTGWACALWLPELRGVLERQRSLATLGSLVWLGGGLLLVSGALPFTLGYFDRALYTFGVIASCAVALHGRPASRGVRFLSDATLGIYLSHFLFILGARPWVAAWEPGAQAAALAAVGLAGGVASMLAARRLLGRQAAARWLGA